MPGTWKKIQDRCPIGSYLQPTWTDLWRIISIICSESKSLDHSCHHRNAPALVISSLQFLRLLQVKKLKRIWRCIQMKEVCYSGERANVNLLSRSSLWFVFIMRSRSPSLFVLRNYCFLVDDYVFGASSLLESKTMVIHIWSFQIDFWKPSKTFKTWFWSSLPGGNHQFSKREINKTNMAFN